MSEEAGKLQTQLGSYTVACPKKEIQKRQDQKWTRQNKTWQDKTKLDLQTKQNKIKLDKTWQNKS